MGEEDGGGGGGAGAARGGDELFEEGLALAEAGELSSAAPLLRSALAALSAERGEEHATTLEAVTTLAAVLLSAGQLEDALPVFERALAAQRSALGHTHVHTLDSLNNVATVLFELRRYEEAEPRYKEALEGRRAAGTSAEAADAAYNLASCYNMLDRHREAAGMYAVSAGLFVKAEGEEGDAELGARAAEAKQQAAAAMKLR